MARFTMRVRLASLTAARVRSSRATVMKALRIAVSGESFRVMWL